jgi:hypothetical protein
MALIVEDGTGLANAQSLVSVADATTILALRLYSDAWTNPANAAKQEAALAWMSRMLTRLVWQGYRVKDDQALCFPRAWLPKRELVAGSQFQPGDPGYYPSDAVPDFAKEATAVGALLLLGRDPTARPDSAGISSLTLGPMSVSYDQAAVAGDRDEVVPREVMDIIGFALARGGVQGGTIAAVRV